MECTHINYLEWNKCKKAHQYPEGMNVKTPPTPRKAKGEWCTCAISAAHCSMHIPRKATHTEIHGPDGELIVLPESPLTIVHRVNMFDELVALVREYHETKPGPGIWERSESVLKRATGEETK